MDNVIEYATSDHDDFVDAIAYCGGVTTGDFDSRIGKIVIIIVVNQLNVTD